MNEESINLEEAKKLANKERVINILLSRIAKLEYEVERLENIINELEKWLIIQHDIYKNVDKEKNTRLSCQYLKVKDKLQELKGSDK